jgi:hypothetical protein
MRFKSKLSRNFKKIIPTTKIKFQSLQFRLTVVTIGFFCSIALLIIVRIIGEIEEITLNTNNYEQIILVLDRLKKETSIALAIALLLNIFLVWQILEPLRQIDSLAKKQTTALIPISFNPNRVPKEVKELARAWNLLLADLSQSSEKQRQFINDISHELRTPLSLIYGYLQQIQRRSDNSNQQEALTMAIQEVEQMTKILQDLLYVARLDSQTIALNAEIIELDELVVDIVKMLKKFEHRRVMLKKSTTSIAVKADRKYLMEILNHLIRNALEYSPRDCETTVELTQQGNWAIIEVRDRGDGISLLQQDLIFEPLYRVDPSRNRATGGSGMGLSIVKSLVERMNGAIEVRSKPGEGSRFIVKLPAVGEKP